MVTKLTAGKSKSSELTMILAVDPAAVVHVDPDLGLVNVVDLDRDPDREVDPGPGAIVVRGQNLAVGRDPTSARRPDHQSVPEADPDPQNDDRALVPDHRRLDKRKMML